MALEGRAARRLEQRLHQPDSCHLSSGTVFRMIFSGCAESLFVETPSKEHIQSQFVPWLVEIPIITWK